jgi:hypothetical protein
MRYPKLNVSYKNISIKDFILHWSKLYPILSIDDLYVKSIRKSEYTEEDIDGFFHWKNGMKINGHLQKQASVNNLKHLLPHINELKYEFDLESFNDYFGKMGVIWQIFLLHIIRPKKYPIFDQHVYRAHIFLTEGEIKELTAVNNKQKLRYYFDVYQPCFLKTKRETKQTRKIDQAYWAFGKFLQTKYAQELIDGK